MAILQHTANRDEILKHHLNNPLAKVKFTSPDFQNEINICGDMVKKKIVESYNQAGYFALIGDEATDVSTHEQVSVCVRFVDTIDGKLKLREGLLGFVRATDTTGETLTNLFIATVEKYGIEVQNMRAQGYDGAANMSDVFRQEISHVLDIVQPIPIDCFSRCEAPMTIDLTCNVSGEVNNNRR